MRRPFVPASMLALSVLFAPLPAQAQVLPGDGDCLNCFPSGCALVEAGANECTYHFVMGELKCFPGGGLCGFDAVSMSGQVVVTPVQDRKAPSESGATPEWAGVISSTPMKYDEEIRAYRRVCDDAIVASVEYPTPAYEIHDLRRIRIG